MGRAAIDLIKLREAIESSESTNEVVGKVGCSPCTVTHYMRVWGMERFVPRRSGPRKNLEFDNEILELSRAGVSLKQQSARLGVSVSHITRARVRLGVAKKVPKMTREQLDRMAELLDDGVSYKEVARTMNVFPKTVRERFPGRGWTHQECGQFGMLNRYMNQDLSITNVPK